MKKRGKDRRDSKRRKKNAQVEENKRGNGERRSGIDRRKVADHPRN